MKIAQLRNEELVAPLVRTYVYWISF